jgi:hypothetical protein
VRVKAGRSALSPLHPFSLPVDVRVVRWRALLRVITAVNVGLWCLAAVAVQHAQAAADPQTLTACRAQLLLSAGYVFACAFRSVLPVYDIPRIVLIDSRWSSVLVGRSVATIGELCFAAQWALILHRIAFLCQSPLGQAASLLMVPLIVIAEGFSWHAVLTTAQRGHAVENSIWGLSAILVVTSLLAIGPERLAHLHPPMLAWCVGGVAYVVFMFYCDVPMYRSRWLADQTSGRRYLSIAQGTLDVWRRRVVSYRWVDWKTEVLWMTLYFTLGVWCSISIVYATVSLGGQSR